MQPTCYLTTSVWPSTRLPRPSALAAMTEDGLQYHVLPDDPLAALNILREAAGLEPWPEQSNEPK